MISDRIYVDVIVRFPNKYFTSYILISILSERKDLHPCLLCRQMIVTWIEMMRQVANPPATPRIVQIFPSIQARSLTKADIPASSGEIQSILISRLVLPTEFARLTSRVLSSNISHTTDERS